MLQCRCGQWCAVSRSLQCETFGDTPLTGAPALSERSKHGRVLVLALVGVQNSFLFFFLNFKSAFRYLCLLRRFHIVTCFVTSTRLAWSSPGRSSWLVLLGHTRNTWDMSRCSRALVHAASSVRELVTRRWRARGIEASCFWHLWVSRTASCLFLQLQTPQNYFVDFHVDANVGAHALRRRSGLTSPPAAVLTQLGTPPLTRRACRSFICSSCVTNS